MIHKLNTGLFHKYYPVCHYKEDRLFSLYVATRIFIYLLNVFQIVPWLSRLVAVLSRRRPGFDSRPVHVVFLADEVAL